MLQPFRWGKAGGAVILGAPVDLAFDVQPDEGADIASSCVTADVAFGDSPVPESRVRVSALPKLPGRSPAVRVQVAGSVNEPVISVRMSAGCSGKITRNYTFLVDPPVAYVPGHVVNIDQLASVPPRIRPRCWRSCRSPHLAARRAPQRASARRPQCTGRRRQSCPSQATGRQA